MGFVFQIMAVILVLIILAKAPEKHDNCWFIHLKVDKIPFWILVFVFTLEKNKGEAGAELKGFRR